MVESLRTRRLVRIASWSGAAFLCVVFLKNAWACDDAYISFRSIEQLFAGNGPRWNPHERVQVFTSPLWYWFLSAFRVASTDVFINAIIASGVSFVATLFVIRKVVRDEILWLAVMVLLVASNGFFDYTSSGLENPLCYLLLSLYLLYFFRLLEEGGDPQQKRSTARRLLFVVGLLLLCRYDLLTLVLAPTLYAIDRSRTLASKRGWLADVLVAFAPVLLWSVFALIYYGTIFPNPAYAKLWTGIAPVVLWQKGVYYLATVARHDPITVAVIVVGAGALLASRRNELRALGVGVFFNLFYIVSVGGDFMLGRFLSHAFLLTALALAVWMSRTPWM
ncbi:MAG: glycosyltransferase family 39 protein, partial [Candidatus Krumholzibacteriota bacterium]|nr:glycosyltransferase family 39 protein [Candidatus Krumholzibacteriota bacterium]